VAAISQFAIPSDARDLLARHSVLLFMRFRFARLQIFGNPHRTWQPGYLRLSQPRPAGSPRNEPSSFAGGTPKRKAVPHTPARPRLALGTPAHTLGPKGRPPNALQAHGPIARAGSGHQRAWLIKVFTGFETHKGHDFIVQ